MIRIETKLFKHDVPCEGCREIIPARTECTMVRGENRKILGVYCEDCSFAAGYIDKPPKPVPARQEFDF